MNFYYSFDEDDDDDDARLGKNNDDWKISFYNYYKSGDFLWRNFPKNTI